MNAEVADQPDSKQQLLCSLPRAAIKQLLKDDRTRVMSENTVFHTITEWHKARQPAPSSPQVKELLQLIRMQHCTRLFVATVISENSLTQQCFTATEMRLACAYSSDCCPESAAEAKADRGRAVIEGRHPVLNSYPARMSEARPNSALNWLQLILAVPVTKLRDLVLHRMQLFQQQ
eukprot:GHUV01033384.1.p1 GENE.GHUV01033384.1~~GHUV01033384.1.p1  ORF type:complete len:176 (+),score=44.76 GHUV01033384.1:121-648(+)